MAGYVLGNTLSESGAVTRGICKVDAAGKLDEIRETRGILLRDGRPCLEAEDGVRWLDGGEAVSMNIWGLPASFIGHLEERFPRFLAETVPQNPEKSEMYIPMEVGALLREGRCTVDVLSSPDRWYGVTYREDKPSVTAALRRLTDEGVYPDRSLF